MVHPLEGNQLVDKFFDILNEADLPILVQSSQKPCLGSRWYVREISHSQRFHNPVTEQIQKVHQGAGQGNEKSQAQKSRPKSDVYFLFDKTSSSSPKLVENSIDPRDYVD